MDIRCPNCKQTADLHEIGEVKHIECPDCGWFKVQADSTFVACDEPPGPVQIQKPAMPEPAEPELAQGNGSVSTSEGIKPIQENSSSLEEPSDEPDLDDEDEIKVVVTFED
jgi:Zn ribbon nucleic-acid-binding protein